MPWNTLNWRNPFGAAQAEALGDVRTPEPIAFAVDDANVVTTYLERTLASLGIGTMSFRSAEAVAEALKTRTPAIVFLDVTLEGSDAVDVIRRLGESRFTGIVQLMSASDLSLLNEVRLIGERHRLTMRQPLEKPFGLEAVRDVVKAANLDGRQAIRTSLGDALRRD
jgi:FixJ family two-component response regulator